MCHCLCVDRLVGDIHKGRQGSDLWDPHTLAALPDVALRSFLVWFRLCHARLSWPSWFLCVLMAAIPKPAGGERTVAKTPMLYRMYGAMRRQHVKDWELRVAQSWDVACPGGSALEAAYNEC